MLLSPLAAVMLFLASEAAVAVTGALVLSPKPTIAALPGPAAGAEGSEDNKYYNDELTLTALEEASLELVYWLEDAGYPAIIVPPTHVDPWRYDGDPNKHMSTLISLPRNMANFPFAKGSVMEEQFPDGFD